MLSKKQDEEIIGIETHRTRTDLRIWRIRDFPFLRPLDIDNTIDDGMSHMNALGTKLPSQGLGQRPHGEFAGRERRTLG